MGTRIQLRSRVPIAKVEARYGSHATHDDYDVLLHNDCKVFAPDGSLLCALVRGGMEPELVQAAYPALHHLRRYKSDNRGNYAGQSERVVKQNSDGTVSRTTRSLQVASAVVGFYDRYPRIPFCRQTAFTAKEAEKWATIVPLAQQVSQLFQATVMDRYKVQKDYVAGISPDFVIPGTVFTTMTVNNCVPAAYHQDAGTVWRWISGMATCCSSIRTSGTAIPSQRAQGPRASPKKAAGSASAWCSTRGPRWWSAAAQPTRPSVPSATPPGASYEPALPGPGPGRGR